MTVLISAGKWVITSQKSANLTSVTFAILALASISNAIPYIEHYFALVLSVDASKHFAYLQIARVILNPTEGLVDESRNGGGYKGSGGGHWRAIRVEKR